MNCDGRLLKDGSGLGTKYFGRNFLSFRFYVKSILENVEVLKVPFRGSDFCYFGEIHSFESAKCHTNQHSIALEYVQIADFALQESSKLISRKI